MRKWFFFFFTIVLILAFGWVSTTLAQEAQPTPSDDEVNAIARNMYCPVCENIPLDVCPTLACEQWREQIREKLAAGWTDQQIYDYFVQQYGDRVLAEPPRRGLNWLVYVVPPLAILFGAFVLYRVVRSRTAPVLTASSDSGEPPAPELPSDEYVARLEKELEARDPSNDPER